jgi:glycoside/pentoside/hexuronide:cation symporter, GPH family
MAGCPGVRRTAGMTTTIERAATRLGPGVSAGYASGSLVTGTFSTVPGLLLLPYLTDTLGVAAGLAGALAFVPKAWSVLLNPVAGRVSDRAGTRRPFILGAGLAVGVAFAVMFAGPLAAAAGVAWAISGYLLAATAFAFFQAPYAAMPAEMTTGYREGTRLMSWRVAGIALTTLVSGALAPALVRTAGGGLEGHRAMGLVLGALIALGAVAAFAGTRRARLTVARHGEPSLRVQLAVAAASRPFRELLAVVVVQSAATGALLAGAAYVARFVLGDPAATTALVVAFTAPALLLLPVLLRRGSRMDKRTGVLISSGAYTVACLALLAAPAAPVLLLVLAVVIGAANAAQDTFVLALLLDRIAGETRRTGRRQGGVFAGLFSAAQGLGFAVGPLLYGLVLQLSGYVPSSTGEAAAQSGGTVTGVLLGFAVLPAVLTALSLIALRGGTR